MAVFKKMGLLVTMVVVVGGSVFMQKECNAKELKTTANSD